MKVNSRNPGIEKQLIPFSERTKEEMKIIATLGGMSTSPKKSQAAKLRGWKQRLQNNKLKSGELAWMYDQLKSDKAMALGMLEWAERIKKEVTDPRVMIQLGKLMNDIFKSLHGEKIKMQSVNINVNAGDSLAKDILDMVFDRGVIDVDSKEVVDDVELE